MACLHACMCTTGMEISTFSHKYREDQRTVVTNILFKLLACANHSWYLSRMLWAIMICTILIAYYLCFEIEI